MNENFKAIIKAAADDEELKDLVAPLVVALNDATDENRPEIVARILSIAHEKGFELVEEDLVVEDLADDEELAAVTGGGRWNCSGMGRWCELSMYNNQFGDGSFV